LMVYQKLGTKQKNTSQVEKLYIKPSQISEGFIFNK